MCSVCSWYLLTNPADKQDTCPTLCVLCAFLTAYSVSWRCNSRWGNSWWCSNSTGDNRCRRVSQELCPLARRRPCRGCRWVRLPRSQGKTFPSKTSTSSFRMGAWLHGEELKCYGERDKSGRLALWKVHESCGGFSGGRPEPCVSVDWLIDAWRIYHSVNELKLAKGGVAVAADWNSTVRERQYWMSEADWVINERRRNLYIS